MEGSGSVTYPVIFSNAPRAESVIFSLTPRALSGSTLPPPNFFSTASRPGAGRQLCGAHVVVAARTLVAVVLVAGVASGIHDGCWSLGRLDMVLIEDVRICSGRRRWEAWSGGREGQSPGPDIPRAPDSTCCACHPKPPIPPKPRATSWPCCG